MHLLALVYMYANYECVQPVSFTSIFLSDVVSKNLKKGIALRIEISYILLLGRNRFETKIKKWTNELKFRKKQRRPTFRSCSNRMPIVFIDVGIDS